MSSRVPSTVTVGNRDTSGFESVTHERLRQPKVEHLDRAVPRELDVRRLEIAVNDAVLMRRLQRLRDLLRDRQGLREGQAPSGHPIGQCLTLDEFKDQRAHTTGFFQAVDRADAWVVQRGQQAGLALEPREAVGVCGERRRQHFEGDLAPELGVAGAIDLPHPARAQERKNRGRPDLPAHQRRPVRLSQDVRRHGPQRRHEKPLRCLRVRQQGFHLVSQRLVAAAGRRHERGPLARLAVQRRVAQLVDTPPPLGVCHRPAPSSSRSNQSFARR